MSERKLLVLGQRVLGRLRGGPRQTCWRALATTAESTTPQGEQAAGNAQHLTGVAGRYAESLLRVAKKANKLSEVRRDVDALERLFQENPRLVEFFKDPTRSQQAKMSALKRLMDTASVTTPYARNLLQLLAENRRLNHASQVLSVFQSVLSAQQGSAQAVVTSAAPLSEWQLSLLRQRLQRRFYPDNPETRIEIVTQLDSDLIGGFTVQLGDKFLDLSLRTDVRRIRDELVQQF
jgi:ATP synthase F1 delta subunit